MNSQKTLASIAVVVLLSIPLATIPRSAGKSPNRALPNSGPYFADGGAPVPPYPKPPVAAESDVMFADGGAPVPPYPKPPVAAESDVMVADGGAPVPPYPKPPVVATA